MPRKKSAITSPAREKPEKLGPDDVARYFELEHQLKVLTKEYDTLKARFKEEIPEGSFPVDDYEVKRWDQIGSLKADEFTGTFPYDEYPDMYTHVPDLPVLLKVHPPEKEPSLYNQEPSPAAIKEQLDEEAKKQFFNFVPYLKISKI